MSRIAAGPLVLALILAVTSVAGPVVSADTPPVVRRPKVLLIGVDGIRVDILQAAETPNFDALVEEGHLSLAARIRPNTVSGPGWSSMLTGVWMGKHGVENNDFSSSRYDEYPDFLTRIESVRPELSTFAVLDWPPLGTIQDGGPLVGSQVDLVVNVNGDSIGYGPADQLSTEMAAERLRDGDPDATFIYLGNTDVVAHATSSLAPEYRASIEAADRQIGMLLEAVRQRPTYEQEDWLILSSTDHGRSDDGGHGGESEKELTIYYLASGPSATSLGDSSEVVDIACTALAHLGIEIDAEWDLDCKVNGVTPSHLGAGESGWAQWRGPLGTGASPDADPPIHWSETENVRFKVEIPGNSLSSPVIWGDSIFLMSAVSLDQEAFEAERAKAQGVVDAGEWPPDVAPVKQRFIVQARSRKDGSLLWEQIARESVPHESHYLDSSWSAASPIVDGERLYVHFGSNGTYTYDLDGNLLWSVDLGDMTTRRGFGEGSSPALHGDALIINWDHEGDSFLVTLDKRTGEELWRTERPGEVTSWATPLVVERGGRTQIIISSTGYSRGYDFDTGAEIWRLAGMTTNDIPTPLERDGVVYLASGYRDNMLQAVDLDKAKGDLEGTDAVLWQYDRDTPYVASVLLYGEQLYFIKHLRNIFSSLDAATGEHHFTARLPGISNVYASPIAAAGRVYVFDRAGAAVVLKHGTELEVLAENELDDGIDATPALVGNEMYIRGRHYLYAIANED